MAFSPQSWHHLIWSSAWSPPTRLWDSIKAIADAESVNLCLGHQSLEQLRPKWAGSNQGSKQLAIISHLRISFCTHTHAWQSNGDALMCMSCGYLTIVNPSLGFVRLIPRCCQVAICQASPGNPSGNPRLGGVILIRQNISNWGGYNRSSLIPFRWSMEILVWFFQWSPVTSICIYKLAIQINKTLII